MFRLRPAALAALIVIGAPVSQRAQDARGTILGRVTDPSGAVIAQAEVRATNVNTGVSAIARSNEAGNFAMPYLLPGAYTIQAEMSGFKKFIRHGIEVRIRDAVEVNIALQLGDTAESIEVKAETPLLSTAEASLGQVVDERRIVELPVFGGSPYDLVHLAPGVANGTNLRPRTTGTPNAQANFSADGAGQYKNEFTLDGVANAQDEVVAFVPPTAAVGEFKVQTSSYDAAIGHTFGSAVNVSIKSGTNQLHGDARWFVRNRVFDTPTLFNNRSGVKPPVYQDNRLGVSAGGPVWIPGLYNGKNRTFWFYTWEWNPNTSPDNFLSTVPTEKMRRGDLSELLAAGSNYQVYDPATVAVAPGGRFSRQPFANNIVPASRLDPVAQKILPYWPMPNQPGTRDKKNNFIYFPANSFPAWVHLGRVDHAFHENHRIFVRLVRDGWSSDVNRRFGNDWAGTLNTRDDRAVALDDVYVFSPSFLINLRYGLTQQDNSQRRASHGFDMASLGFSQRLLSLLPDKSLTAFPNVQVGGLTELSNWSTGDGTKSWLTHTFTGNLTKLHGDHNFRFGAEFRVYLENSHRYPLDVGPQLTFPSSYTRGPLDNSPAPPYGAELTAFLLGIPGGGMGKTASYAENDKHLGLYFQDDFKVSPRLTLNLGLRYELETPITERFNRSVAGFAFDQSNPVEAQAKANYARNPIPELPASQFQVRGGLTYVNVGGNPRTFWKGEKNNFMPRLGFAYQLRPKTVLRGGYAIFCDTLGTNTTDPIQTGFSMVTPIQASLDNGLTFRATTADPLPNGLLDPVGAGGGLATNLGQSVNFFPPQRKHPYAQRWSFGLQRALPGQFLAEASYVGNRGTRLQMSRNLNFTPGQYLSRSPVRDQKTIDFLSQQFPNPLYGTNSIYGTNTSRSGLLVPYPQFSGVNVTEPVGYSWYHSLQVRGEKRFSHGYTFQLSYTWSKMMEATRFLNASDPLPYESLSTSDRTHRLVMSGIWELPFGRGRRFGGSIPKALDALAGGWQLNMVVQRQSGPPMDWADVWTLFTGNPDSVKLPKDKRNVDRWFNIDAGFNRNSAQQLSSNIRVSPLYFSGLRADGQARWDLSAIKNFRIVEQVKMQLRAEAINAWNHPNLFLPQTSPTSSAFGTISNQDYPRNWILSLRLVF